MNRRDFLAGAATGAVVGVAGTYGAVEAIKRNEAAKTASTGAGDTPAAPQIVKQVRELKMVTSWPPNFPGLGTAALRLSERISALTEGALKVTVFAGGEMVPAFEAFDAVSNGTADMYHGADYYWQGKSPAFNFFTTVPGGFLAPEINAWIYHAGGQELWDEVSGGFDVKPFLCGNTGVQMGGWFNKEIKSAQDFNGLKFRMPGLGGEALRRLGAAVQNIPASDIFPALQQGTIDGTEWVGPWNDLALGLYKVTKHYYWPGFHEPGAALALGINRTVWNSLSASHQALIAAAAGAENAVVYAEFMARNGQALQTMVREHGVQLRQFPNDVMQATGRAVAEVMAEIGDSDPLTRKVYDSYIAFRKEVSEWTALSEQGYANARATYFS